MTQRKNGKAAGVEAKELRFAEAYIANGENGRRAHMEVYGGENENSAAVEASKLLKKPNVFAYIEKRRAELLQSVALTAQNVYREVARCSFYDPRKLLGPDGKPKPLHELDADTAAAISALEMEVVDGRVVYRVRPHSKTSALDQAIKLLRLNDAPPPPPPDETGVAQDPKETARRMAFLLRRGEQKKLASP